MEVIPFASGAAEVYQDGVGRTGGVSDLWQIGSRCPVSEV